MNKINTLTSFFNGGVIPEDFDSKAMGKLQKKWGKLESPRVVRLYPIRRVAHEDTRYCVYACPLKATEIDGQTLQAITALVDEAPVGDIRYDSVMSSGDYFKLTENGTHILDKEYRDAIVEISDRFDDIILFSDAVLSPKKAVQLDSHYAIIGLDAKYNQYSVLRIPNCVIGEPTDKQTFMADDEEEVSPETERLRSALMTLSAIITIGVLIWYFLFR